jgi:hypothetical protein
MMRRAFIFVTAVLLAAQLAHAQAPAKKTTTPAPAKAPAKNASTALPPMKRFPTAKAVVDEHLDAINKCDWTRLMAQYPDDVEFFLPGGKVVQGRAAVGDLFRDFVKPAKDGGLCGLKFTPEHVFTVDGTINVAWVGNADFMAEPYRGADAYITKNGMMQAQVTTFDGTQLKMKK